MDSSESSINEVVLKEGFVTFSNANLKDAAVGIAGTLAGGIIGNRLARKAADNLGKNGHGVLTDRRFVFGNSKPLKKIAVGTSVNFGEHRAKGDIVFDIPLADIVGISQGKQGFSTLFILETNDGVYKFALMKKSQYPEWESAFNKALGKG